MVTIVLLLFLVSPVQETDVPLKPKEEFEIGLNYEFRKRLASDRYTVDYTETRAERAKSANSSPLPYLVINTQLKSLPAGEVRVKVYDYRGKLQSNKKIKEGDDIKLDLGFTDDLKDRVASHEYNIIFYNDDKNAVCRIHLFVEEDGSFLVNGEMKGKF